MMYLLIGGFLLFRTMDSKLNNFTRIEPVLALLQVPFDTNTARDVMTEKHGTATKMLYQLFISLNKKEKNNLTGVAMESMRAPAPVKLENVQSEIYKEVNNNFLFYRKYVNFDMLRYNCGDNNSMLIM